MRIPTSYNQLTVRQLIECGKIISKGLKDYDENIHLAAYLTSKSVEEIECLPYDQLFKLTNKVSKIKLSTPNPRVKRLIWIKGIPYKPITDINKFSAKRYLHLVTQTDLHKRASICFTPIWKGRDIKGNYQDPKTDYAWDDLAESILDCKVKDVYGAVFFYARIWKRLQPVIQTCLELNQLKINHHMRELALDLSGDTSQPITDGIGVLT